LLYIVLPFHGELKFLILNYQITVRYAKFLNTITPDIDMFTTCI